MVKRRMQDLILEILQAQPSLRDSKSYLQSFAPRKSPVQQQQQQQQHHQQQQHPPTSSPPPPPPPLPRAILEKLHAQHQLQRGIQPPLNHHDNTNNHPATSAAAPSDATSEATAIPATTSTSDSLADSHTALVKVQGPFTDRQLDSIAEGLVYLEKLGLVCVCVVDHDDWPDYAAEIDQHGRYVAQTEELEQQHLQRWLHPVNAASTQGQANHQQPQQQQRSFGSGLRPGSIGRKQERLRKRILADTLRLADALNRKGAMARPFPQSVIRVDAAEAARIEAEAQAHPHGVGSSASQQQQQQAGIGGSGGGRARPPLVSDDSLRSIRSALAANEIPVLAPFAIYENEEEGTLDTLCVRTDDVMVALARDMVVAARRDDAERERQRGGGGGGGGGGGDEGQSVDSAASSSSSASAAPPPPPLPGLLGGEVDLMPLRLMVINREGGIPSHARGGDPHLSINLASEYHQIRSSFIWSQTHPTALRNLDAISDCLRYMPQTSSGVLVTHRSPRSLIANLITNKAAHSPSLPHRLLANKKDVRHTPTIIRPGLPVRVIEAFEQVDQEKLTALLEASFRRRLDRKAYFARLKDRLDFVIVTGDYQGAAIVTREYAPGDDREEGVEAIAYLDKFAVLPSMQGSGTVDFLWGALRDEVQGLGLLDALNDNGGKGGYGKGRDLVWKSRSDNPVNRWYYERSNGFVRIDTAVSPSSTAGAGTGEEKEKGRGGGGPAWQLFWCDAEDKLARLSGERKVTAPSLALCRGGGGGRGVGSGRREEGEEGEEGGMGYGEGDDFDSPPSSSLRSVEDAGGGGGGTARRQLLRPPSSSRGGTTTAKGTGAVGGSDPMLSLLPIVAPEEGGRLVRWAECMKGIPSAWAD